MTARGLRWAAAGLAAGLALAAGGAAWADGEPDGKETAMTAQQETYEFLKECGAFFVATDDAGQPRVRPFGALALWEGRLYLQTGNFKAVFRQMQENPRVEVCGFQKDKGRWIRVTGTLVRDDRREAREAVLEANPGLKGMYSADDGRCEVLYFGKGTTAVISAFGEESRTLAF
jgi:uncharacterized pyridoxamine 5'-phosphate oxidase family protein